MSKRSKNRNYRQRANDREQSGTKAFVHGDPDDESYTGGRLPRSYSGDRNASNQGWQKYRESQLALMPATLPRDQRKKHVDVYVEGYEDISFWRAIFDSFESEDITFEISVPPREDLAKGKKVLLGMVPESSPHRILCVDSDFDYIFGGATDQSGTVTCSDFMFHTYAYATENFLCYAPSLHNVCVRATKNDTRIFDFVKFMEGYSRTIYPLFVWYAYSARLKNENVFTLIEFKSSVKLNYLEVENNGKATLEWLARQVSKRVATLEKNRPGWEEELGQFASELAERGVVPENTYMYMQGHTLMDNVVMIMLNAVCEQLKLISNIRISTSTKTGTALKNELSNYNNALRSVRDVLLDNEGYRESPQYIRLRNDIENFISKYL